MTINKRSKFWVPDHFGLYERDEGGTYLLAFTTRGHMVRYHNEDDNLVQVKRNEANMFRFSDLENLCTQNGWEGVLIDPPFPSENTGEPVTLQMLELTA